MTYITTEDGTEIFYKDWGPTDAQPIVFHHGWPLSADDWDNQMLFFLREGYRVIAHDRRGHGRSSQTSEGNEMDTYVADVAELVAELDLEDAIHIGHSTGGGEVTRYVAQAEPGRVARAVLIDAVTPVMVQKESNPGGTPLEVFDGYRAALAANRAQLYLDIPTGPFYGFNRPGATLSEGLIRNWWRQGMTGSAKAHYECIKAFSETDFTEDLKAIEVPVLVIHSEDDQIVPYADSAPLAVELLTNGTLITYKDLPHGLCQTHPEIVNADILAFLRGEEAEAETAEAAPEMALHHPPGGPPPRAGEDRLLRHRLGRVLPHRAPREVLGGEVPVEVLVDHRLEVVGPLVLVIEVVGVLPHVDRQQRNEVAVRPRVRQRVAVVGFLDRQLAALFGEPDPAAGEVPGAALGKLLLELVVRSECLVDPGRQIP